MFRKRETDWKLLKDDTGLSHNVIIDVHFRGLTPLNDVDPKDHILESVQLFFQPHRINRFHKLHRNRWVCNSSIRVLGTA